MDEIIQNPFHLDYETLSLVDIVGQDEAAEYKTGLVQQTEDLLVRGILHRAGRAGFYHWKNQQRELLDWDEPTFRFSPVKKKIGLGLDSICKTLRVEKRVIITIQSLKSHWLIEVHNQQGSSTLQGDYLAGFVQEFCSWAGLGKFYRVVLERENLTSPGDFRIKIFKDPLDD